MDPVAAEITYGIERIAMFVQKVDSVYDLEWVGKVRYGDVHHRGEVEHSTYNFEVSDTDMLFRLFSMYEAEARRTIAEGLVLPAYDYVLKCSHTFNLLDARNAISVTERTGFISRVRAIASACCEAYVKQRKDMGFPLMNKFEPRAGR
jgi:glycyl-tRNA synthetase alpha chain